MACFPVPCHMIKRITIITGIVTVFLCAVSCGSDWSEKLGDGYVYVEEGREWNFILGPILNIPPNITSYTFDDSYIVATQMPLPSNLLNYYHSAFEDFIYPEGKSGPFYWVVIKKEQNIFGPLDEEGLRIIKDRYQIPERLKNRTPVLSKKENRISDYSGPSTIAAIDSTFCSDLALYRGWEAKKCGPNLYGITILDAGGSRVSFWVLKRKSIVCVRMNLPENVLDGWIPVEGITDNALWNHYYAEKVSADKIVSFSHILDKYGIEEITINQRDFSIIAKQTLLRLPFSFPDD